MLETDILLIDKPKRITSYDVIRVLKEKLPRGTKLGHAGTLDPNASGLLIVGINDGTKKLRDYLGMDKTYEVEVLLGVRTDSGDITGEVLEERAVEAIDEDLVRTTLNDMVGPIRLPVSKFSSKKVRGKRSHELARAGEEVPEIPQDMDVREAVLNTHGPDGKSYLLDITFDVSSGTYIRSLAEELGSRLGVPATLKNLRRTRIGDTSIDDAQLVEEL